MPPVAQRLFNRRPAPREDLLVEPSLPTIGHERAVDSWTGEREQPPDVGWCDEVPRRPHHMRAQDQSVIECTPNILCGDAARPKADSPGCTQVILSLHGAQPRHDLRRSAKIRAREPLIAETES